MFLLFRRWDGERLEDLEEYDIPGDRPVSKWRQRMIERRRFWPKLAAFLEEEGVLAMVKASSRDNGLVRVTGSSANRELS